MHHIIELKLLLAMYKHMHCNHDYYVDINVSNFRKEKTVLSLTKSL